MHNMNWSFIVAGTRMLGRFNALFRSAASIVRGPKAPGFHTMDARDRLGDCCSMDILCTTPLYHTAVRCLLASTYIIVPSSFSSTKLPVLVSRTPSVPLKHWGIRWERGHRCHTPFLRGPSWGHYLNKCVLELLEDQAPFFVWPGNRSLLCHHRSFLYVCIYVCIMYVCIIMYECM